MFLWSVLQLRVMLMSVMLPETMLMLMSVACTTSEDCVDFVVYTATEDHAEVCGLRCGQKPCDIHDLCCC